MMVSLQNLISNPKYNKTKTYIVQVEGEVTDAAVMLSQKGVQLKDGNTKPAIVKIIEEPNWLWARIASNKNKKKYSHFMD